MNRQESPKTDKNGFIIRPDEEIKVILDRVITDKEKGDKRSLLKDYTIAYNYVKKHLHRYFTPNGKQEEFIKLKLTDKKINIFMLFGGNDTGKTAVGVNCIRNLIYLPENPYYVDVKLYENFKRPNRGRIISDPTTIDQKIIPELKKWLDNGTYETHKKGKTYEYFWDFSEGSSFDIMSYEQEIKEFESVDLNWILCDERLPRDVFVASLSRLRDGGIIFIVATPLANLAWMEELIDREDVRYIVASKEDNCKQHGIRGIRDHQIVEQTKSLMEEEEIEARVYGRFMHLSGRIYKMFNKQVHIIDDCPIEFIIQRGKFLCINALDPHDRKPFVFIWAIVTETQDIVIIKEFPVAEYHKMKSSDYTIYDYSDILKEFEGDFKVRLGKIDVDSRIIDPMYGNRRRVGTEENKSIKEELEDLNFWFLDGATDVAYRRMKVKEYLNYDATKPVNNFNRPKLFILKSCKNTIYGLQHHIYAENKDKNKEISEKDADTKAKCFANCVEYICSLDIESLMLEKYQETQVSYNYRHAGY